MFRASLKVPALHLERIKAFRDYLINLDRAKEAHEKAQIALIEYPEIAAFEKEAA